MTQRIGFKEFVWPFRARLTGALGHLPSLHEVAGWYPRLTSETDQSTLFHKEFAEAAEDIFTDLPDFIWSVVAPALMWDVADLLYQRVPTLRVHLPGNVAVGEWHSDREYGHTYGELTCWMPMTTAWGTNTVWIESEPFAENFQPLAARPSEIIVFDGVRRRHGNKVNDTHWTRVSVDFRIVKRSCYRPTSEMPSDYWAEI